MEKKAGNLLNMQLFNYIFRKFNLLDFLHIRASGITHNAPNSYVCWDWREQNVYKKKPPKKNAVVPGACTEPPPNQYETKEKKSVLSKFQCVQYLFLFSTMLYLCFSWFFTSFFSRNYCKTRYRSSVAPYGRSTVSDNAMLYKAVYVRANKALNLQKKKKNLWPGGSRLSVMPYHSSSTRLCNAAAA